jgi:hypothetical protein
VTADGRRTTVLPTRAGQPAELPLKRHELGRLSSQNGIHATKMKSKIDNFATIITRALPGVGNPFDRRVVSPVFL